MSFPDNCLRGIWNEGDLTKDGSKVRSHLFDSNLETGRSDGWESASINWQDDDQAVDFTLSMRKTDGLTKFTSGVAILPRESIDTLRRLKNIAPLLNYERQELDDNKYHGNILYQQGANKHTRRAISALLGESVVQIIPQK